MAVSGTVHRKYDHNIRNAVCATGDAALFDGIPLGTARTWIRRGPANVVSFGEETSELLVRIQKIERANTRLRNVVRLLLALIRAFGFSLAKARMPDAAGKRILMHAADRAAEVMPRKYALHVIGLTPARLTAWKQAETGCALDDRPSCPRARPTRTSALERMTIRLLTTSERFAHFSTRALALYAQRKDLAQVSVGTWYRLIREAGWKRPRFRIHPRPPKVGLRAGRAGQYLHIDITEIRLTTGARAYIQAIIDNFSRMVLAYAVSDTKTAEETSRLVRDACATLGVDREPMIIADDGGENCVENPSVASALIEMRSTIHIAGVDLLCSNFMIERFWMQMKHNFLFTRRLDSMAALRRFVDFFVEQHNDVMHHAAFGGQTPAEVFLGEQVDLPRVLAAKRAAAKDARLSANRGAACGACPATEPHQLRSVP